MRALFRICPSHFHFPHSLSCVERPQAHQQQQSSKNDNAKAAAKKAQPPPPQKGAGGGNNQVKGGGGMTPQMLQQLQQMKALQDLKMGPQFMKDVKSPALGGGQNQKGMKLPEEALSAAAFV